MKYSCRFAAAVGVLLVALAWAPSPVAQTQPYPSRPVRIVVAFPAGGPPDTNARAVAGQLSEQFGRPVVVENRAGGGGAVGIETVAKATPDGYTLLFISQTFLINAITNPNAPYDVNRDFTPVVKVANSVGYLMVINPSVPATNLREFVALSRGANARIAYGTPGIGSSQHLAGELFNQVSGARLMHVPYKGVAPALTAVLAGDEIHMISLPPTVVVELVKSGKLRALAITSPRRWPIMPDVPTAEESGVPYRFEGGWIGLVAPAKTAPAAIRRIQQETNKAVQTAKLRDYFVAGGYEIEVSDSAAFQKFLQSDRERWAKLIAAVKLPAQ